MDKKELERKIQIQKEYYAHVSQECAYEDTRANSNHYYKIEQIEKGFYDYLISRGLKQKYNFMEVGVGTGIHAQHFLNTYRDKINKFLACDLSKAMLDVSKIRLKEYQDMVNFYQSPAEEIEPDMKLDGIYISGAMHHFAAPYQAILKAKASLDGNGVLIICEPNVWNPYNFVRAWKGGKKEIGQFTTARRGHIRKHLEELDFDIIEEKVLHYRSGWNPLKRLWPYEDLNKYRIFDVLSIMFLFVARQKQLGPQTGQDKFTPKRSMGSNLIITQKKPRCVKPSNQTLFLTQYR